MAEDGSQTARQQRRSADGFCYDSLCCVLQVKEAIAVIQVRKYREMKQRYPAAPEEEGDEQSAAADTDHAGRQSDDSSAAA